MQNPKKFKQAEDWRCAVGEFEDFIKAKYPVDYESLKEKYPNVPIVEFYGDEQDVWNHQQSKIEQLEKEKAEITRLVQSLRNEFDLNSDCPQVDRQIELLEEALRGECE